MIMETRYHDQVLKYKDQFVNISLDDLTVSKIENFVKEVVRRKKTESHHFVDRFQEEKRWKTGFLGEAAVEKFLNLKFMDLSIGCSRKYHISDLSSIGIDCGIKTVEFGKFPVIFKKSSKSEIIVIKNNDFLFSICGVATKKILNQYQDDDLILSPSLRAKGTKTGFYGFKKLI